MFPDHLNWNFSDRYFLSLFHDWRKYHRVIQRDFLTLHALLPLFRHYDDIDGPRRYAKGRKDPTIEEYDEIGMFIRGSKVECKRNSSVRNSLKTPDRNTVYSLQKEVLSTDFWRLVQSKHWFIFLKVLSMFHCELQILQRSIYHILNVCTDYLYMSSKQWSQVKLQVKHRILRCQS